MGIEYEIELGSSCLDIARRPIRTYINAPMQVKLLAFAQAHDQLGFKELLLEASPEESPRSLLARVAPGFRPDSARLARDCEYCSWDQPIGQARELAIIPPVSGG